MAKNWIKIGLLLLSSICFSSNIIAQGNYYRYKDKDGHPVISSTLPSEVVDLGYEIISPRGTVIETISPRESKEQQVSEGELEKQAEIDRKKAQVQAHKDEILLKSFTNETDIERSRKEKIASIEVLEEIVHENIDRLQKQLNREKNSAANYTGQNQKIPEKLQKTIDETLRQINENKAFLERKKTEKVQINTKYKGLVERFRYLQQHPQTHSTPH